MKCSFQGVSKCIKKQSIKGSTKKKPLYKMLDIEKRLTVEKNATTLNSKCVIKKYNSGPIFFNNRLNDRPQQKFIKMCSLIRAWERKPWNQVVKSYIMLKNAENRNKLQWCFLQRDVNSSLKETWWECVQIGPYSCSNHLYECRNLKVCAKVVTFIWNDSMS